MVSAHSNRKVTKRGCNRTIWNQWALWHKQTPTVSWCRPVHGRGIRYDGSPPPFNFSCMASLLYLFLLGTSLEMIEQSQFLMVWTCFSTTVPRTCSILSWKEKKKLNPNMTKLTSGVEWSWARKSQLHQRLKRCQVLNIKRHALFNLFACPENTTECTIPSLKATWVLIH